MDVKERTNSFNGCPVFTLKDANHAQEYPPT